MSNSALASNPRFILEALGLPELSALALECLGFVLFLQSFGLERLAPNNAAYGGFDFSSQTS